MASTQLAAFHQPVLVQSPPLLYHCCNVRPAASVLALKSSTNCTGLPEPPLTARIMALALVAPDWKVSTMLFTGLELLASVISAAKRRGLLLLIELTVLVLRLTRPFATNAIGAAENQSAERKEVVSVLPSA